MSIPDSEYQPKPDDIASPTRTGCDNMSAAIIPPKKVLSTTIIVVTIPTLLSRICFSEMLLLRNCIPISSNKKTSTTLVMSSLYCQIKSGKSPAIKPAISAMHTRSDSKIILNRDS